MYTRRHETTSGVYCLQQCSMHGSIHINTSLSPLPAPSIYKKLVPNGAEMSCLKNTCVAVFSITVMVDIAAIAYAPKPPEAHSSLPSVAHLLLPPQARGRGRLRTLRSASERPLADNDMHRNSLVSNKISNTTIPKRLPKRLNTNKHPRKGNWPDLEWQAITMDHLRQHPRFDQLPPTISSLSCLEDVRSFRQDSWQWEALHQGRCTTSQAAAALGFFEPMAGDFLDIPPSWRRGGIEAYHRMRQPALRSLEEMEGTLCTANQQSETTNEERNERLWYVPKQGKFQFAARYLQRVTEADRECRRKIVKEHPMDARKVKMIWGMTQEATALLTALNYIWREHEPDIRLKEVGMCGAGINEKTTGSRSLLIGASPDALLCYPNGTVEVLEVKNHCPFVMINGRTRFAIREMFFQKPYLPPLYVSQMMMEMKCVGPDCKSAVMVRQTASTGAFILRLHRDDEWIDEMIYWLTTFQSEFVDNECPPPQDFFWEDQRYRRFLERTIELCWGVQVLKHVPHHEIQRKVGRMPNATPMFLD